MKIAITGGAGFIGANLARYLLDFSDSISVRIIDDLSSGLRSNVPKSDRIEFVEGSILDPELLTIHLGDADSVVHLAARPSVPRSIEDPRTTHNVNVTGTLNVLEAVRASGHGHVIVASSSSVYGANEVLPKVESLAPRPLSPYAASKLATESYALAWSASYRMPVLALRFFNVFGPLQRADHVYAAAIPKFIQAILDGTPINIYGSGEQTRDFTYVDSLCAILALAATERIGSSEPVNAAFGSRTSLLQIVELLAEISGQKPQVVYHNARAGDVLHSQADSSRLTSLFPHAGPTDLRLGLQSTFNWLADHSG